MRSNRIEFISEYCDRWCERCAFTNRCSAYAVQAALGMCGDLKEALQLAVGVPMAVGDTRPSRKLEFVEPTPEQQHAFEVAIDAHQADQGSATYETRDGSRDRRASMVP